MDVFSASQPKESTLVLSPALFRLAAATGRELLDAHRGPVGGTLGVSALSAQNPHTREVEARGSEGQDQPQQHSLLQAVLGYMRPVSVNDKEVTTSQGGSHICSVIEFNEALSLLLKTASVL